MKQQLNEIKRMQQLAGLILEEITPKNKDANKLQFILRDLCDFYGEETADDLISDEWKNYTVGQIIQDWINLKKQVTEAEAAPNVVDTKPELQKYLRDLSVKVSGLKGADSKEIQFLATIISGIVQDLEKGSLSPALQQVLKAYDTRTKNLG